MEARYRGWIPTVTGRLSFSHFGDLKGTTSVRRSDPQKRYLVAYAKRKTGDALVPWLARLITGIQGYSWFACVAETTDLPDPEDDLRGQGILSGRIFVITDPERWGKYALPEVECAAVALSNYDQDSDTSLENYFSSSLTAVIDQLGHQCVFQTRFQLRRDGIVDFFVDDEMQTSPEAPRLAAENNPRIKFGLAHQAYSFLKDIGHHHKHHSQSNDTITDLHDMASNDDRSWRRKTMYGIYRRIITYMRRPDIETQISSVGLLAYARSFKAIWIEEYPDDDKTHTDAGPIPGGRKIPIFHDSEMKESMNATELRMKYHLQRKVERDTAFRTLAIGSASLLISFIGIVKLSTNAKIDIMPARWLMRAAGLVLEYPYLLLVIFLALYVFRILIPRYSHPQEWRPYRFIHVAMQAFSRSALLVLLLVIAALCFSLGIWLLLVR